MRSDSTEFSDDSGKGSFRVVKGAFWRELERKREMKTGDSE